MAHQELKTYTAAEERVNIWTHLIGGLLFLPSVIPLRILFAADPLRVKIGVFVYYLTILGSFFSSANYHAAKAEKTRIFSRKIDHCAIYYLIAGTYTPILLVDPLYGKFSAGLLAALWGLAAAGTVMKFTLSQKFHKIDLILYVLMGWCALLYIVPICRAFPRLAVILLFAGGIAYTGGIALYVKRVPFAHGWWHVATFSGVLLHYLSILALRW